MSEEAFLRSLVEDPTDASATWLAFADWLEERGDRRAAAFRLCHQLAYRTDLSPDERANLVNELVALNVVPCVPSLTNTLGMSFVLVPPGTFLMGSPDTEAERYDDEIQHEVEIT